MVRRLQKKADNTARVHSIAIAMDLYGSVDKREKEMKVILDHVYTAIIDVLAHVYYEVSEAKTGEGDSGK